MLTWSDKIVEPRLLNKDVISKLGKGMPNVRKKSYAGDFNIHVDNAEDTDAIKLIDLLESYGLQQHVTSPTHKHDHTLDLIITHQSDQLLGNTPRISRHICNCPLF